MRERQMETKQVLEKRARGVRSGSVEECSPGGGDVSGVWGRVGGLTVLAVLGQFLARFQLVVIQELRDLQRGTKTGRGERVKRDISLSHHNS